MKIGNIFTTGKIEVPEDFNVVRNEDELIAGIPTLYVGFDYVDKHFPNFDITNKCLEDGKYWTFKRSEKRDYFEETLKWFILKSYQLHIDKSFYIYVDPINYNGKTLRKIIKKILSIKGLVTYIIDDMVYMYGDNYIFGINFKVLKFIGTDVNKIRNKIISVTAVLLEGSDILIEYKNPISILNNKLRYIPLLYSIRNEKNNVTSFLHIS